ncbi:HET domain containing protein [Rhypophila decipiens]
MAYEWVYWINECHESHTACPQLTATPLPTRLLDVCDPNTQSRLRLFETLGAMQQEINLGILPRSLQDAVFLTRNLGLRYLWIDALCIVQDSREYMEKELKIMAQTYRNATITISAATASSVHDGFLQTRRPKPSKCPRFKLPFLQERIPYNACADPINQRAWTLQERLLSQRLLIYSTHTLV